VFLLSRRERPSQALERSTTGAARQDMETWPVAQRLEHLWRIAMELALEMSPRIYDLDITAELLTAPLPHGTRRALVGLDMAQPRVRAPQTSLAPSRSCRLAG
jgi:hypothetical protein